MITYKRANLITGWIVFIVASIVYLLTIEPTASFWDCGEFIAAAFKLEVGHPPGAPFFMILGRFFTLFAGGDKTRVPIMINSLSALASSFTILFLFWTITHLGKKLVLKVNGILENGLTTGHIIAILGSGLVGALAYTFSDTFWFSAVEGEVYASSSLFTALVFWAILKWENVANEKYSNRWLVLIAYLMGLSIGVHLLNLLAIPAIVFVYYFKKYEVTRKGLIRTTLAAIAILGGVMYAIIPGVVKVASWFELLFVNSFHLHFNSGLYIYLILLVAFLVWAIYKTHKAGKVILNTIVLCITVILIGYSSFAVIMIRSAVNPPMDQNDPQNLFSLLYYLNREQYGDRPLFKGEYYNAPIEETIEVKPIYKASKDKEGRDKYVVTNYKLDYKFNSRFTTIFPRMYSRQPDHIQAYKEWGKVKGTAIRARNNQTGEMEVIYKPTFGENLRFFVRYQIGFMYLRYFMWNFAGRQNDIQGHGDIFNGNWISGIPFIDEARLGPQDNLPQTFTNNKARNKYYMLPLLLGLIGVIYHYRKMKKDFTVVALLFILTGLAIVVYLNQYPFQPRERDYAYAGSFYAFAIWIGLGVIGIVSLINKKQNSIAGAAIVTLATLFLVPGIMAKENWNDHNRSGRYTARDFAYNYLNSCAPNSILFTNGDNDTFPLWYVQEVEEERTDVRVINLSYLGADWYIKQMQQKVYESDIVPFSLTFDQYQQGSRDVVYIIDRFGRSIDLKQAMDFLASDDPKTKTVPGAGAKIEYLPAKSFTVPVDSAKVTDNGTLRPEFQNKLVKNLEFPVKKNYILKNEMMVMDLVASNNWERPIYYAITVSDDLYLNLQKYFQVEGLAFRIVPVENKSANPNVGMIASDIMYDNMMNKFRWGGVDNPNVYLDENNIRMLSNFRNSFSRLAEELVAENKNDSALQVLNRCMEIMPHECVPYNYYMIPFVALYFQLGEEEKAMEIINTLSDIYYEEITYYNSLPAKYKEYTERPIQIAMYVVQQIGRILMENHKSDKMDILQQRFEPVLRPAMRGNP
ncbi:MAG: DUF2723 domain-containing protein [Bacteroidales bacterium]|nr:DUF2723 domain-containing protein [Bacteroidales bacterium]